MASYIYLKRESKTVFYEGINFLGSGGVFGYKLRLLAVFFFSFGIGLLSWLLWPFLEWRIIYVPRFTETEMIRPFGENIAQNRGEVAGQETADLTNIHNWFSQEPTQTPRISSVKSYSLSIPILKIFDAQAIVGGEDLSKSLIHYGGTALPGENGTAIVFGHSVLPQFFNPEDYKSIFSTLHTLKKGDKIAVDVDGINYQYKIFGMEVIDPSDISFLRQKEDDSYLYLITCTPPGTYWKRLVVKARLETL